MRVEIADANAFASRFERLVSGDRGLDRRLDIDPELVRSIAVKVDRLPQSRKMFWVTHPQYVLFGGQCGREP